MKHGSDRGPTISMKPRLLAAFTAVAMMFATAVPSLLPQTAVADGPTDLGPTDSGFYKPGDIHLGDDMDRLDVDTGVATWVGRDMYIGGRPAGTGLDLDGTKSGGADGRGFYNFTKAPTASYAAEAEGLTIVKGKLAINQIKDSWAGTKWKNGSRIAYKGGQGFRFGIAGFGAQFRPASGSTALVVAGQGSNISSMTTGGVTGNVGAWNHNGWIGKTATWDGQDTWTPAKDEASYKAEIAGNGSPTFSQGYFDGYTPKIGNYTGASMASGSKRDSIGGNQGAWGGDGLVNWNATNPLKVNGVDRSEYTEKIKGDSETFAKLNPTNPNPTGGVSVGTAPKGDYTYYRYSYNNNGISYSFSFDESNNKKSEKLITFEGDGTSNLQVFNITSDTLTNGPYGGIDFKFTNIPEGASIVINVTGDNVQFNTGWRFWWDYIDENGHKETLQIGNGYYLNGDDKIQKAYVQAARSIMWNFADAKLVTINGGQYYAGTGGNAGKDDGDKPKDWGYLACGAGQESNFNKDCAGDDPAAAMLGSIMVPKGSFDSHVTTNGRVWVGEDFMMNNPTGAAYFNKIEGVTSSVLDMDQERHNLPWSGSVTASASMIQLQKSNGSTLIPGSSWKLYRTLDDAQHERNPITTVTDNGTGDWNTTAGIISVTSLVPNKNYYIRENGHMQGYERNNNIYLIQTTNTGDTLNTTIAKVWNENGGDITGTADAAMTTGGAIINTPVDQGTNIEWGKYAAGDTRHTPLRGSSWDFSSDGGTTWTEITDVTEKVADIEIKQGDTTVTNTNIGKVQTPSTLKFTASVKPTGAPRGIKWTSSNDAIVVEQDGTVDVRDGDGSTVVTLTAASTSNPSIKATVSFTPLAPNVDSIEIYKEGETQTVSKLTMTVGETVKLEAVVHPQGTPTWETTSDAVALTTGEGGKVTVEGVHEGTATVTANVGTTNAQVEVTVQEDQTRTAVYILWPSVQSVTFKADGQEIQMKKVISCSDNWFVGYVNKNRQQFTVSDFKANTGDTYGINGGATVTAGSAAWKIESGSGSAGAPGCAAQGDVPNPEGPSGFADEAVVADEAPAASALPTAQTEGESNDSLSSTLQDADSRVGLFKLENLPDGEYKLKEHTAPEGFTLNSQVYTITIAKGTVTWNPNHVSDGIAWISDKPTQVVWDKVDSDNGNALLADSGWTIEQMIVNDKGQPVLDSEGNRTWKSLNEVLDCTKAPCNASVTYKDEDPTPGKFLVKKLPVNSTYRITETTVPKGYEAVGGPYEFTVSDSEETVQVAGKTLGNTRKKGKVYWGKVSSEDDTRFLAGSAWTVTYTPYGGTAENEIEVEITDCVRSDGSSTGTCSAAEGKPDWAYDAYGAEGRIGFDNLPWGSYEMIETKAPDGYYADPDAVYVFTVDPDTPEFQNVVIYKKNADGTTGDAIQDPGTQLPDYPNQLISNEPGVVLPATGGEGNTLIVLFGFALIAISMLGCGVAMRKRI
jgi:choice-of-anchor A domain-containing protein/LPXTG-motif cell wall-anchored protein